MAIMEGNYEQEMMRLWAVISEMSEALNQHRAVAASLHAQAGGIKSQAIHSQTGFALRRFNLDKPKEEYDAELERMNTQMSAENQGLQHDNKQLNALIKEYEQTLETLMTTFRNRAHEVQEHELNLIREYESALVAKETEVMTEDLNTNMAFSASLSRLGQNLRRTMRALNGEECPPDCIDDESDMAAVAAADWALDRESELARLERENAELRRMLGIDVSESTGEPDQRSPADATRAFPAFPRNQSRGGGPGVATSPLGTFKRRIPG